jgi:hypothetical protein
MLTLYWLCFVTGGVFVLLAIVGGFDGVDFDGLDGDAPFESDLDIAAPGVHTRHQPSSFRPKPRANPMGVLCSLKFWTFGVCFFGLTGLVLSSLSIHLPASLIITAAVGMGIICGALVAGTLRALRERHANSLVRSEDVVGLAGIVTLPFDRNSRGKVQLKVKGSQVERIAYTDEDLDFHLGDRVLVVGIEQERLWVVSTHRISSPSDHRLQ